MYNVELYHCLFLSYLFVMMACVTALMAEYVRLYIDVSDINQLQDTHLL